MEENLKDRAVRAYTHIAAALEGFGMMALWALVSLLLLIVIAAFFNPAKFGTYLWIVSKLVMGGVLGYVLDRAAAHDNQPEKLEGIERAMAQTRRATLMAAFVLAAGLSA